jgi:hypothetical protein
VPEHDPAALDLEDRGGLAAVRAAAVLRTVLELEDGEHLARPVQLEVADAPAARQARVPAHGVGVRRQCFLAVLDDL